MLLIARWLPLFLFLLLARPVRAEGLLQLGLSGQVVTRGGAPIELEIALWDGSEVRQLDLNVHLAQGTSAHDVATILVTRLRRLGAKVDFPGEGSSIQAVTHVFVEAVTSLHLRLGHGLAATVTLCDTVPKTVRFQPPQVDKQEATIVIAATTFHPHTREIGRATLELAVDEQSTPAQIAEELAALGLRNGWVANRPTPDRWSCEKTTDGAYISGCSIHLIAQTADWRVEVELEVPRGQ